MQRPDISYLMLICVCHVFLHLHYLLFVLPQLLMIIKKRKHVTGFKLLLYMCVEFTLSNIHVCNGN